MKYLITILKYYIIYILILFNLKVKDIDLVVDLIKKLLDWDKDKRINAEDAYNHEFFN